MAELSPQGRPGTQGCVAMPRELGYQGCPKCSQQEQDGLPELPQPSQPAGVAGQLPALGKGTQLRGKSAGVVALQGQQQPWAGLGSSCSPQALSPGWGGGR